MGAHVILLCNFALICFIVAILERCVNPNSEVHQRAVTTRSLHPLCFPATAVQAHQEAGGLRESSAALSTLVLGGFTFQAPLLSLFAAGDAVGAREVGGAQMKKNR